MKKTYLQIILLTLGSIMFAGGIYFFRMPNNFVVGGASGLAIIFSKLFPYITKGQFVTIINIICAIAGFIFLGKSFSWKTFYCSIVYSVAIMLLEQTVKLEAPFTEETFAELVLSVVLCGIGAGIVIDAGGSTGGIEIFALIVKKKTHYTVGNALMVFNLIIATCAAWLFGIQTCFLSIIGVLAHSLLVDKVIQWLNSEKVLLIVTESEEEILNYIKSELSACATILNAVGSFTNKESRFIMVVLSPKKASALKKRIKSLKNGDFVVSMDTFDLIGGRI
ncbi:MAG: YitT family protein [Clostridia bacterium]|nr:YitT family protein [Clostridia bacterium]